MTASQSDSVFVDRVYEASVIPEYWPQVLRDFARMAGAQEAALLATDSEGSKLVGSSPAVDELAAKVYSYPAGIERTRRLVALRHAGFVTDRDVFTRDEMVAAFQIGSVGKAGAKFDVDKLHWMCGEYIRAMPLEVCFERARPWLERSFGADAVAAAPGYWRNAVGCFQERVQLLSEFGERLAWLVQDPEPDEAAAKVLQKNAANGALVQAYGERLATLSLPPSDPAARAGVDDTIRLPTPEGAEPVAGAAFATPQAIEAATREFLAEQGAKFGQLVQPTRALLTGTNKGPGFFDIVWLLGAEACARRLRDGITAP